MTDPTLPARLAALGFEKAWLRGCEVVWDDPETDGTNRLRRVLWTSSAPFQRTVLLYDGPDRRPSPARERDCSLNLTDPTTHDAAARFVARLLAGKQVLLPDGWRWIDPVIGSPYLRNRADDKILSDDCDGWTLKRCEPLEIAAWLIAKGHAIAAVHLAGLVQAVAWAEGL